MYVIEPATQYVVSVRAFNDIDKGAVIYDLVYTASNQGMFFFSQYSATFTALSVQNDFTSNPLKGYVFALFGCGWFVWQRDHV